MYKRQTSGYPTVEEYADEVCKSLLPLIIANGGVDKIRGIGSGAPTVSYTHLDVYKRQCMVMTD